MAKDKKIDLKDCSRCRYKKQVKDLMYCILRLQDEKVLKSSGIVTQQECGYFTLKE